MDRAELHRKYRYIINWLYPNVCPLCGTVIEHDADFCESCRSGITLFTGSFDVENADRSAAYCVYDHNIDNAILHFKKDDHGNCYYAFACGIAESVKAAGMDDIDIIVPIPITREKLRKRGFNQTELIAKELRYLIGKPYFNVLTKEMDKTEQKKLHADERARNVSGVFGINAKAPDITGKCILLIDDVCTTGSTLAEAAKVLRNSGAGKVYAVAFAKTVKKDKRNAANDEK